MFYEGDLQSGIALAVREAKQVICFVHDDTEESLRWENEYLADEEIAHLVTTKAVLLRLKAGSQEAAFLSSFCPLREVPTLVVIKDGELREYIVSGLTDNEFKCRLKVCLGVPSDSKTSQQGQGVNLAGATTQAAATPVSSNASGRTKDDPDSGDELTATDRARRESIRAGKRRADAVIETKQPQNELRTGEEKRQHEQRRRIKQEREERERILKRIRQDNEDRRLREEKQKGSTIEDKQNVAHHNRQFSKTSGQQFRLQIRLFDGSSVRCSFSPTQTIRGDVRPWLDRQRTDGDAPYTLKHILTPLPNRTISISEEDQTLTELSLGPTANLVMVPVKSYTEAYASSESALPIRGLYAGYNFLCSTLGAVAGAVGSILGFGQEAATSSTTPEPSNSSPPKDPSSQRRVGRTNPATGLLNVRTLQDQRDDHGEHQFYNGNQLNFEPRRDQDKDD